MSLKELTADLHTDAENTAFMKAVIGRKIPLDVWADFTYQKSLFYNAIEGCAGACSLLNDLPDIQRTFYLYQDFKEMAGDKKFTYKQSTIDYYNYILGLYPDANKIMAHVYVWHMGDLFGGQMIKKVVNAPSKALEFADVNVLKERIRSKIDDSMADEARVAFQWAIKIMQEYTL